MTVHFAIIILNWCQSKITIDTVDSILKNKSSGFKYHIFIIDNASTDSSVSEFKKKYFHCSEVSIHQSGRNLGYAGGNNYGLKIALKQKYSHFLIANNDIIVRPDFLQKLYIESLRYPEAILTPKIYFAPGFEYHKDRYQKSEIGKVIWSVGGIIDWNNIYGSNLGIDEVDRGQYDHQNSDLDFISGCCLLVPKKVFKSIGYFDEKYFLYFEDADFTQKAKRAGYQLRLVPDSIIWHLNSASSKPGSSIQDYFITRNRLLFASRYASFRTKFALFRESIKFLFSDNTWKKNAVRDYFLRRFGKGSWK